MSLEGQSLNKWCELLLGKRLLKQKVKGQKNGQAAKKSHWRASVLTAEMQRYAADDAAASLQVFEELTVRLAGGDYNQFVDVILEGCDDDSDDDWEDESHIQAVDEFEGHGLGAQASQWTDRWDQDWDGAATNQPVSEWESQWQGPWEGVWEDGWEGGQWNRQTSDWPDVWNGEQTEGQHASGWGNEQWTGSQGASHNAGKEWV